MTISISNILDVLRAHNILPIEDEWDEGEPPEIGEIGEDETVYTTSIAEVFREGEAGLDGLGIEDADDPRIREWWNEIERIIEGQNGGLLEKTRGGMPQKPLEPSEPHCAWYCPIHFFGHGWGIYIRENCILSKATNIARIVDWSSVRLPKWEIARQLLRSSFYLFFLHEQFHHKVESLGFRLLIANGSDRYRPYKSNVYRKTHLTSDCLEESLANAESYRRLSETRYATRTDKGILDGLRKYLKLSIPLQPPGYAEGVKYLSEAHYRDGLYRLQSLVLDGAIPSITPLAYWSVAPNMITALADIAEEIYVILPRGSRPIFSATSVDPGATVSTQALACALTKYHGYHVVPGGKGSHVKLARPGAATVILPGNRPVLSPGIVKQALEAIGGYPISRARDLLDGRLNANR